MSLKSQKAREKIAQKKKKRIFEETKAQIFLNFMYNKNTSVHETQQNLNKLPSMKTKEKKIMKAAREKQHFLYREQQFKL